MAHNLWIDFTFLNAENNKKIILHNLIIMGSSNFSVCKQWFSGTQQYLFKHVSSITAFTLEWWCLKNVTNFMAHKTQSIYCLNCHQKCLLILVLMKWFSHSEYLSAFCFRQVNSIYSIHDCDWNFNMDWWRTNHNGPNKIYFLLFLIPCILICLVSH
jgi:hypothetical protein